MEPRRSRRSRTLPAHLRGFVVEDVSSRSDPCEPSQLAVRLDHTYSCISARAPRPTLLEERYLNNAAVLPDICPAVSVSSVDACQEDDPVTIHGHSIEAYQDIYRSVVEAMLKTPSGRRRPYSLELGQKIKQRLWKALNCPSVVETEQPDGRVLITESFSTPSRRLAPQINVDISEEPLQFVDHLLKVIGLDLTSHDFHHLLADLTDLLVLSMGLSDLVLFFVKPTQTRRRR